MKLENCKVGVKVKIKNGTTSFLSRFVGKECIITGVDHDSDCNTVRVNFSDHYSESDWGHHKDLKMIKEDLDTTIKLIN